MNFDFTLHTDFEVGITEITQSLKEIGFGILTRIDFDQKIKEKLGEILPRIAILGACNPQLAYQAYRQDEDMLLLIPCNVVVEEIGPNQLKVKVIKPSSMMSLLANKELPKLAVDADCLLEKWANQLGARS